MPTVDEWRAVRGARDKVLDILVLPRCAARRAMRVSKQPKRTISSMRTHSRSWPIPRANCRMCIEAEGAGAEGGTRSGSGRGNPVVALADRRELRHCRVVRSLHHRAVAGVPRKNMVSAKERER